MSKTLFGTLAKALDIFLWKRIRQDVKDFFERSVVPAAHQGST
jgi:hypothetical protein